MPWNDQYATGHAEIDRQHRVLFGLIDQVNAAHSDDYGDGVQTVLDLIKYVIQHFGYEDDLMVQSAYPDMGAHRDAHIALNRSVTRFREGLLEGTLNNAELRSFLDQWLQHHIGESDKRLALFLAGKGKQHVH